MNIDSILTFFRKNIIVVSLSFSAVLMFVSAALMIMNKDKIDTALQTQALAEKAKFEILFSHLNVVRDLDVALRGFAIIREERLLYIKPDQLVAKKNRVFNRLDSILKVQDYDDSEGLRAVKDYQNYISMLVNDFDEMSGLLRQGNDSAFMHIFKMDKGSQMGISMNKAQNKIVAFEDGLIRQAVNDYSVATRTNIIVGIVMVLLGIPSIIILIIRLRKEAKQRELLLQELDSNNRKYLFDSGVPINHADAKLIIAKSIENFRDASDFVTLLSKGDYSSHWRGINTANKKLNENNLAGKLVQLRENLNAFKAADKKRIWTNEGLSKLSEVVRNHQRSIEGLSLEIVKFLAHYLNFQQGGLFIVQEDEEEPYLKLSACYAFERKKYVEKNIRLGEGLIGQVYMEGETVFLKEIPPGYLQITSGLGDAAPHCIVIVPMKYNGKIEAIIELASFTYFEDYQIEFLEKAGEFVASAISNTKASEKMKQMLHLSQRPTEES